VSQYESYRTWSAYSASSFLVYGIRFSTVLTSILGGFYGYYLGGGWQGGQAEYQLVPYADFSLLPLGPKSQVDNKGSNTLIRCS
jgi:hypothetical protein